MEIKQKTAFEHLHLQSMLVKCRKYSFKLLYILIIIHIRLAVYGTHTPSFHTCTTATPFTMYIQTFIMFLQKLIPQSSPSPPPTAPHSHTHTQHTYNICSTIYKAHIIYMLRLRELRKHTHSYITGNNNC